MEHNQAVDAIKKHLWGMDYAVKDAKFIFQNGTTYDLIVAGQYQLKVKEVEDATPDAAKKIKISLKGAEYLAVIDLDGNKLYSKGTQQKNGTFKFQSFETSTYAVFGKPEKA